MTVATWGVHFCASRQAGSLFPGGCRGATCTPRSAHIHADALRRAGLCATRKLFASAGVGRRRFFDASQKITISSIFTRRHAALFRARRSSRPSAAQVPASSSRRASVISARAAPALGPASASASRQWKEMLDADYYARFLSCRPPPYSFAREARESIGGLGIFRAGRSADAQRRDAPMSASGPAKAFRAAGRPSSDARLGRRYFRRFADVGNTTPLPPPATTIPACRF